MTEQTRRLGSAQAAALERIALHDDPEGWSFDELYKLSGKAKQHSGSYWNGWKRAVDAHNAGECAPNCPVDPEWRIVQRPGTTKWQSDRWDRTAERSARGEIDLDDLDVTGGLGLWAALHAPAVPAEILRQIVDSYPWWKSDNGNNLVALDVLVRRDDLPEDAAATLWEQVPRRPVSLVGRLPLEAQLEIAGMPIVQIPGRLNTLVVLAGSTRRESVAERLIARRRQQSLVLAALAANKSVPEEIRVVAGLRVR